MINKNKKAANDICGMFVDEYLEDGNASGFQVSKHHVKEMFS